MSGGSVCEGEVAMQGGFLEEATPQSKFVHSISPDVRKQVAVRTLKLIEYR